MTGGWCGCEILWYIFDFVDAVAGWKVCKYCGIGRASIIVILLIRHRFAKKMSMKEHDLVTSVLRLTNGRSSQYNSS